MLTTLALRLLGYTWMHSDFLSRSWVRASWINVNNSPTRCDYIQFIIFL